MRTIVLSDARMDGFTIDGILFTRGVPKTVEDDIAERALGTGRFRDNIEVDDILEEMGISKIAPGDGYVLAPKNLIGDDNLEGKRILIRRPGGIGDNVFVAVLAQHLKNQFPTCKITLGTTPGLIDFMRSFDAFDSIITVDHSCSVDVTHANDYVMQLSGVMGSEDMARIDDTDYFRAHWDKAGIVSDLPAPFPVPQIMNVVSNQVIQESAAGLLREIGYLDEDYCVLVLGTSNPLKRIRPEKAREIAQALSAVGEEKTGDPRIRVLALASGGDRVFTTKSPWINVKVDVPLPLCVELIRRSRLAVGCDTGLIQLAGALQVPTVSLWGPTDPLLSMDHYGGAKAMLTADARLECAPCRRLRVSHCPYYTGDYAKCMKEVPVEEVRTAATRLLEECPSHPLRDVTTEAALKNRRSFASSYCVAVLLDYGKQFTGGGYYTWTVAKALAQTPGVSVTVFTDAPQSEFAYTKGEALGGTHRLNVVYQHTMKGWDTNLDFDLVVGTPPFTGVDAVRYAAEHGVRSALLLYETPNFIKLFRKGLDSQDKYWEPYRKALTKADYIWPISTDVKQALSEWIPKISKSDTQVSVVTPVVNTAVADAAMAEADNEFYLHKKNTIVMIARNEKYKDLANALHIAAVTFPAKRKVDNLRVVVIGDGAAKLMKKPPVKPRAEIVVLEQVPEDEKWEILRDAKVVLHPSTFEGFGIPVAEGLYAGARVIARRLPPIVRYFDEHVQYYDTDDELVAALDTAFSEWGTLKLLLEDIDEQPGEHNNAKARHAAVKAAFTPDTMQKRLVTILKSELESFVGHVDGATPQDVPVSGTHTGLRIAFVSPWNTQCGIAETTKDIAQRLHSTYRAFSYTDIQPVKKDGAEVVRCWNRQFKEYDTLLGRIADFAPNVVHIEHEHSLFQNEKNFFAFIAALKSRGIRVVVTLHTYLASKFIDTLNASVDAVILTKPQDEMLDKFQVIPLPVTPIAAVDLKTARDGLRIGEGEFVVGSFGMWQVHKGFKEFLATYDAVANKCGRKMRYLISGSHPDKSQYHMEVRRAYAGLIKAERIMLYNDYPPVEDVIRRLSACNVLVFNYSVAHHSSSSAAIRTAFSAHTPMIVSSCPMFSEFEHETHVLKVPFTDKAALVDAIMRLYGDLALGKQLVKNCDAYAESCRPELVAEQHDDLYKSLIFEEALV